MKVLVSGSLRGMEDQRKEEVRAAARELGKCLAAAGHTLLVGTADPDDVDPFVVEGFMSAGKTSQVEVHLMKGAPKCYSGQSSVTNNWHRYDDWDVTVLEVVRYHSDAVIVMAGRKGVVQAGIAGWMLGRPNRRRRPVTVGIVDLVPRTTRPTRATDPSSSPSRRIMAGIGFRNSVTVTLLR